MFNGILMVMDSLGGMVMINVLVKINNKFDMIGFIMVFEVMINGVM